MFSSSPTHSKYTPLSRRAGTASAQDRISPAKPDARGAHREPRTDGTECHCNQPQPASAPAGLQNNRTALGCSHGLEICVIANQVMPTFIGLYGPRVKYAVRAAAGSTGCVWSLGLPGHGCEVVIDEPLERRSAQASDADPLLVLDHRDELRLDPRHPTGGPPAPP